MHGEPCIVMCDCKHLQAGHKAAGSAGIPVCQRRESRHTSASRAWGRADQTTAPALISAERRTLRKAGFRTLWDVLQHYPRDYSQVAPYPWTEPSQLVGVKGTVVRQAVRSRTTLAVEVTLAHVQLDDGTPLPQGGSASFRAESLAGYRPQHVEPGMLSLAKCWMRSGVSSTAPAQLRCGEEHSWCTHALRSRKRDRRMGRSASLQVLWLRARCSGG